MKSTLVGLFGRSPFRPMQHHMDLVARCAHQLVPLLDAAARHDFPTVETIKERIFTIENEADVAKNEIRANLPRSLLMPVDRRDLLEILHTQDSIADTVQDVAGLLILHPAEVPAGFGERLGPHARRVVDAVDTCHEIIGSLDELLEVGFRGREVQRVEALIDELGSIESETDDQGMELAGLLFGQHADLDIATFVLWNELIRRIGDVADHAEAVGDRLRLLLAR